MLFRRNVLILHHGALGDFIVTWPLAMAMGRMFPQSRIIYIAPHDKGRLAEKAIRVESGEIESGWHALFTDRADVPDSVQRLLSGAHTIFSFISQKGDVVAANLAKAAPEAKIFHMTTRAVPAAGHVSQWLVNDLADLPAAAEAVRQMLRSIADRGLGTHRPVDGVVAIHPGSGSPTKNWPAENFLALAERLKAAGRPVRVILGEVELEKWPAGLIERFAEVATIIKPRMYTQLYEELTTAAVFVGNDSGPGHLAAMIGVPTVSLFGPSDPAVWRPMGPNVVLFQREPMEKITVDEVLAAVQSVSVTSGQAQVASDDD